MQVPFIDLARSVRLIEGAVRDQWAEALAKCEFVAGPSVTALEADLNQYLGVKNTVACANGTDALLIALQALGVKAGDKVALPNLTFWATYEVIEQLGAIPVLIDIDPDHLQLDFSEFKKAFAQEKFKYAMIVHLMGWASPELPQFRGFCQENGIELLEDGAQCFGVEVGSRSVFEGARVSTLSFYPAKVLGGCMDGGAIMTDDADLAAKIRSLCNHGRSSHYSYSAVGWNSRMSGLNARFLREMLPHMKKVVESRRNAMYALAEALSPVTPQFEIYLPPKGVTGNGYLSVLRSKTTPGEQLVPKLKELGVACGRVYPETMSAQPCTQKAIRIGSLQHSTEFCKQVINPPLFYGITTEEIAYVASSFRKVVI